MSLFIIIKVIKDAIEEDVCKMIVFTVKFKSLFSNAKLDHLLVKKKESS